MSMKICNGILKLFILQTEVQNNIGLLNAGLNLRAPQRIPDNLATAILEFYPHISRIFERAHRESIAVASLPTLKITEAQTR